MEDDNVDLDELIEKKERRKQKRMAKLLGQELPPVEESRRPGRRRREESIPDETLNKKRGRPKKGEPEVTQHTLWLD